MPKVGILHDYDLEANREKSAQQQTCVICGTSPTVFQWSDYSGEGMCTVCGCPYQLKWGNDEQKTEGKYPYLNIKEEYIHILKEYWDENRAWVCHGTMLGLKPGLREFNEWLLTKYPELFEK